MLSLEDSLGVIRGEPGSEGRGSKIGQRDSGTGQARSHPSSSSSGSRPHYHHHRSADAPAINLLQSTPPTLDPSSIEAPSCLTNGPPYLLVHGLPLSCLERPLIQPPFSPGPPINHPLRMPTSDPRPTTTPSPHPHPTSFFPSQSLGLLRYTIHMESAGDRLMETHAEVHTGPSAVPTGALGTSPGHPDFTRRSIMHETLCVRDGGGDWRGQGWPEAGETAHIFRWS